MNSHAQKFRPLASVSGAMIWLNIAFPLVVGLMQFPTPLLAESNGAAASQIHAGVTAFASLTFGSMSAQAGANVSRGDSPPTVRCGL